MAPLDQGKGVWKSGKGKGRHTTKGRQVTDGALADVRALLGDRPRRRDLLIEHLHLIQDKYGHLSAAHLRALSEIMDIPQVEIYEVASFYHHFDVVREGETAPAPLTERPGTLEGERPSVLLLVADTLPALELEPGDHTVLSNR